MAPERFMELFEPFDGCVPEMTPHSREYLQKNERGSLTEHELLSFLHRIPRQVYIQKNGCYVLRYEYKKDMLEIIVQLFPGTVKIVTFYIENKPSKVRT
jgi:hypothetical protein